MIISHKYRFIFIKTRKTAGTSIEVALESICGEDDIITPIYPEVENHRPRNHDNFYNHIGAQEIQSMVSEDIWANYYKFTIERNPWDKMVSMYWWRRHQYNLEHDFEEFCHRAADGHDEIYTVPSDFQKYSVNGQIVIDHVVRYENLSDEITGLWKKLGLPKVTTFPREKSVHRKDKRHYSEYYDVGLYRFVNEHFKNEIKALDYRYEVINVGIDRASGFGL